MLKSLENPEYYESYEEHIKNASVERLNEILRNGNSIDTENPLPFFERELPKTFFISNRNNESIEVTDDEIGIKLCLSLSEYAHGFGDIHPHELKFEPYCKIFPSRGFVTSKYAEFYLGDIALVPPNECHHINKPWLKSISFYINDILISVSLSSFIWNFLLGGYDYHCTIKFSGNLIFDIEDLLAQAIFHINSNLETELYKVKLEWLVYNTYTSKDDEPSFTINPQLEGKNFSRKDDSTPFKLFYFAQNFLGYYRVLEYFYPTARCNQFHAIRYNQDLTPDKFMQEVDKIYHNREAQSLETLVKQVADDSVLSQARQSGVITEATVKSLANSIYDKRNSIVHSKMGKQIALPSLLKPSDESDWVRLLRRIAIKTINTYCGIK